MSAENAQNDHDDNETPRDDHDEEQLYDTTQTAMSRRDALKWTGVGIGAAATGSVGTAMASHGDDDPLDGDDDEDDEDWLDEHTQFLDDPRTAATAVMVGGPGAVIDSDINPASRFADWMLSPFDSSDDQLEADVYFHGKTVQKNTRDMLGLIDNDLQTVQNHWIASGKLAVAEALEEGRSEEEAVQDARAAVFDAAENTQRNVIKTLETVILRQFQFTQQLEEHPDTNPEEVLYVPVRGVVPIHVELLNGEVVESWAGIVEGDLNENLLLEHPYNNLDYGAATDDLGNTIHEYIQEDVAELDELIEENYTGDTNYDPGAEQSNSDYEMVEFGAESLDSDNNAFQYVDRGFLKDLEPSIEDEDYSHDVETDNHWIAIAIHDYIISVAAEAEQIAHDAYAAHEEGIDAETELVTNPVVYAEEMAGDWSETGHHGYAEALAIQMGHATDLDANMEVRYEFVDDDGEVVENTVDGATLTASYSPETHRLETVEEEEDPEPEYDVATGEVYEVPVDESARIIYTTEEEGEDGEVEVEPHTVVLDAGDEFELVSATDADGEEMSGFSFQQDGRYTVETDDIIEDIESVIEVQADINDHTDVGSTGGLFDGDVPAWSIFGLVAAVIAYVALDDD